MSSRVLIDAVTITHSDADCLTIIGQNWKILHKKNYKVIGETFINIKLVFQGIMPEGYY